MHFPTTVPSLVGVAKASSMFFFFNFASFFGSFWGWVVLVLNTRCSLYTHALGFYLILEIIYKEKLPKKKSSLLNSNAWDFSNWANKLILTEDKILDLTIQRHLLIIFLLSVHSSISLTKISLQLLPQPSLVFLAGCYLICWQVKSIESLKQIFFIF